MVILDSTVQFRRSDVAPEFLEELKKAHTISLPWEKGKFEMFEHDEETQVFRFPRSAHRFFVNEAKVDVIKGDRRIPREASKFDPREGQEEAIQVMTKFLSEGASEKGFSGGILSAGCGKGKTIMASKILLNLGVPTCILVHKEFLEKQWKVALQETLGSRATVGVFRRNKKDNGSTHDVVVASTQTITSKKRDIPEEFLKSFGLLVLDEVHRYGAEVWQTAIWKYPAAMRLGLTATPDRMDGMWPVIYSNIGPVAYELESEAIDNSVYIVKLRTPVNTAEWGAEWMDKMQRRAKMLSALAVHEGRNKAISGQIEKAYKKGRRILVISERINQLEILRDMLVASGGDSEHTGLLIGGTKKSDREAVQEKQVIFSTYGMSKEGLDIPSLDTLFLASPQADIRQTVGRILRDLIGKCHPITVDFVDTSIEELVGQAFHRLRDYQAMGCNVYGDVQ